MALERFAVSTDRLMFELAPHSDLLDVVDGRVQAVDLLPMPLNEHGIPDRTAFLHTVLGTVATSYEWQGTVDEHHLAYPRRDYLALRQPAQHIGASYRGTSSLKIRLPRQLHDYSHLIIDKPPVPEPDVMQAWTLEHTNALRLANCIRPNQPVPAGVAWNDIDAHQHANYLRRIKQLPPSQVGVLPDHETLQRYSLDEARLALAAICRVQSYQSMIAQPQPHAV